jgi:hypothetical protein
MFGCRRRQFPIPSRQIDESISIADFFRQIDESIFIAENPPPSAIAISIRWFD